jgi:hypothetical protein
MGKKNKKGKNGAKITETKEKNEVKNEQNMKEKDKEIQENDGVKRKIFK